jgi:hypothetical protein
MAQYLRSRIQRRGVAPRSEGAGAIVRPAHTRQFRRRACSHALGDTSSGLCSCVSPAIGVAACGRGFRGVCRGMVATPIPDPRLDGASIRHGLAILIEHGLARPRHGSLAAPVVISMADVTRVRHRYSGSMAAGLLAGEGRRPHRGPDRCCMTRSLAGYRLPTDNGRCRISWRAGYLSQGLPFGAYRRDSASRDRTGRRQCAARGRGALRDLPRPRGEAGPTRAPRPSGGQGRTASARRGRSSSGPRPSSGRTCRSSRPDH